MTEYQENPDIFIENVSLPLLVREFDPAFYDRLNHFAVGFAREDYHPSHADTIPHIRQMLQSHIKNFVTEKKENSRGGKKITGEKFYYYRQLKQGAIYVQPGCGYFHNMLAPDIELEFDPRMSVIVSDFTMSMSWYPLLINKHAIERFSDPRVEVPYERIFTKHELNQLMLKCLCLSYAFDHCPQLQNSDVAARGMPILIPAEGGAFIGHTQPYPQSDKSSAFNHDIDRFRNFGLHRTEARAAEQPQTGIIINTFLPYRDIVRGDRSMVYYELVSFFDNPDIPVNVIRNHFEMPHIFGMSREQLSHLTMINLTDDNRSDGKIDLSGHKNLGIYYSEIMRAPFWGDFFARYGEHSPLPGWPPARRPPNGKAKNSRQDPVDPS